MWDKRPVLVVQSGILIFLPLYINLCLLFLLFYVSFYALKRWHVSFLSVFLIFLYSWSKCKSFPLVSPPDPVFYLIFSFSYFIHFFLYHNILQVHSSSYTCFILVGKRSIRCHIRTYKKRASNQNNSYFIVTKVQET